MPLTIYKYIFKDILRLLLLATGVLVVVMSFGASIKPLSEGMLGPLQMIRLIGYLMPTMLVYALPFGAAFSVTLVFFRLSSDNEIAACSASGVSYRSLCFPVLMLGIVLTLGMFFMSNWVVPHFWQKATNLIEQDITRMVVEQIRRRETVEINNLLLYADDAEIQPIDPSTFPQGSPIPHRRIVMKGVAVAKFNKKTGELSADYTSELAIADFYRQNNRLYAKVMLINATVKDPRSGLLVSNERLGFRAQEIPLPLQQKPKFLSLTDLRKTAENPDLSPQVLACRQQLTDALIEMRTMDELGKLFSDDANHQLQLNGPLNKIYEIQASKVTRDSSDIILHTQGQLPVVVRVIKGMNVSQRLEATTGEIEVMTSQDGSEPRLNVTLHEVTVIDRTLPTPRSQVAQVFLPPLYLDSSTAQSLEGLSSFQLLELARHANGNELKTVHDAGKLLAYRINKLRRDIGSRLHERAAGAVTCLAVMVMAAVMAMLLRRQTPLVIFFWCFLPAIVNMMTINSGQNWMDSTNFPKLAGMAILWSGIMGMFVLSFFVYLKLNRN